MVVKEGILAFESGKFFVGRSFGSLGENDGEIVFNTSMTGYQEIITDPSYYCQIVAMTYPHIGNYGINLEDMESRKAFISGFVVKEASSIVSNWRANFSLSEFLITHGIIGLEGVDTRALTKYIREAGAMKAVISTADLDPKSLVAKAKRSPGLVGRNIVSEVTCAARYIYRGGENDQQKFTVCVLDCGCKNNILEELFVRGCRVVVLPAGTSAADILNESPDGILLSNGPGDPAAVTSVIEPVKELLEHMKTATRKIPIFGICLGHQMLGLALGGKTYKLKFGHRGANHPVKDVATGKIQITSQNHGFCVDPKSFPDESVDLTHFNLYDNTLEGLQHKTLPVFSVQYHPEASPGPQESKYLFEKFLDLMTRNM
jgi:carbamoyl-phosphate synthase small subunit